MKRAIGYLRVSTHMQGHNGIGLEAQRVQIEAFAQAHGYSIITYKRDIATGTGEEGLDERPGLRSATKAAKQSRCPIIVTDISRIARNVKLVQKIIGQMKIEVLCASTDQESGPISLVALAARRQFEAEEISRRTKKALSDLKAQGVKLGNRTNLPEAQKLASVARQQKADKFAAQAYKTIKKLCPGQLPSNLAIAEVLNQKRIPTSRSGQWTSAAVARVLARVIGAPAHDKSGSKSEPKAGKDNPFDDPVFGSWS
jgi:DNA invertase Pin-like site-specific DNA recombinase